jgi:hypothetical protein
MAWEQWAWVGVVAVALWGAYEWGRRDGQSKIDKLIRFLQDQEGRQLEALMQACDNHVPPIDIMDLLRVAGSEGDDLPRDVRRDVAEDMVVGEC